MYNATRKHTTAPLKYSVSTEDASNHEKTKEKKKLAILCRAVEVLALTSL